MFSNPFVFVVESFVLSLIPSVRHDPNLVSNPIMVFTALDLAMVLENRRSAKPRSGHNSPPLINTLHEFFFKFLAVRFRSSRFSVGVGKKTALTWDICLQAFTYCERVYSSNLQQLRFKLKRLEVVSKKERRTLFFLGI